MVRIAVAQDYDPGNFERQKGVISVFHKRLCSTCKDKVHIATFLFENGLNIEKQVIHDEKKSGLTKYIWNSDGTINSAQFYHSFSGEDKIQKWDSTIISDEVKYDYAGAKLNKITWTDGGQEKVNQVVNFYYGANGKVAREEKINSPVSGIVFGFKPNSNEIIDLPPSGETVIFHRTFRYAGDSVFVDYFNRGARSGSGRMRLNKAGKTVHETVYTSTGTLIYECKNRYNQAGKILEQNVVDTGYDGYGNSSGDPGFDNITFRYDQMGRLAIVIKSFKGVPVVTDFYEYH